MFGNWEVNSSQLYLKGKYRYALVSCSHVESKLVSYDNLVSGKSKGCNNCGKESRKKNRSRAWTLLHSRWCAIKSRCRNPDNAGYFDYGARGIDISNEFYNSFDTFYTYVTGLDNYNLSLELDRINNNKGYEHGNLQWVTSSDNKGNTRKSVKVFYDGKELYFAKFVREYTNISYSYARALYKKGISLENLTRISPRTRAGSI
jgi:hypothetical protein